MAVTGIGPDKVVLDAQGFSFLATDDRRLQPWLAAVEAADAALHLSALSVAEAADGSARDALVRRALRQVEVHDVTSAVGLVAGCLRNAAAGTRRKPRDLTVDAVVAATAVSLGGRVVVLTSDPDDLAALLDDTGVRIERV